MLNIVFVILPEWCAQLVSDLLAVFSGWKHLLEIPPPRCCALRNGWARWHETHPWFLRPPEPRSCETGGGVSHREAFSSADTVPVCNGCFLRQRQWVLTPPEQECQVCLVLAGWHENRRDWEGRLWLAGSVKSISGTLGGTASVYQSGLVSHVAVDDSCSCLMRPCMAVLHTVRLWGTDTRKWWKEKSKHPLESSAALKEARCKLVHHWDVFWIKLSWRQKFGWAEYIFLSAGLSIPDTNFCS